MYIRIEDISIRGPQSNSDTYHEIKYIHTRNKHYKKYKNMNDDY